MGGGQQQRQGASAAHSSNDYQSTGGSSSFVFDSPIRSSAAAGGAGRAAVTHRATSGQTPAPRPATAGGGARSRASGGLLAAAELQQPSRTEAYGGVGLPPLDPDLDLGGDLLLASVNAQLDQVAARLGLTPAPQGSKTRSASSPTAADHQRLSRTAVKEPAHRGDGAGGASASRQQAAGSASTDAGASSSALLFDWPGGGGEVAGGHQKGQKRGLAELEKMLNSAMNMGGPGGGFNTDPRTAKRECLADSHLPPDSSHALYGQGQKEHMHWFRHPSH